MAARSKARKRALDVLYAAEARGADPLEVLAERLSDADAPGMGQFAEELVRGVAANRDRLDGLIAQCSIGWSLERMPAVDRAILRIAILELTRADRIDAAVAIDEAVELAKSLSTDSSPRFINGVLAKVVAIGQQPSSVEQPSGVAQPPGTDQPSDTDQPPGTEHYPGR